MRRAICLGAVVALNAHSLLTMPSWQPDTWERIVAMALRDFDAVEPAEFVVFVWFGMWSLLLAALILLDGEVRKLPAWPFAFSSMVLGPSMVLLYQAFRGDAQRPRASRTRLAALAGSPWVGVVIAAISLGALWDGRGADLGQLWLRFQTDYFTHAMIVDEALFAVLVPVFVADDLRRTGRTSAWIWASGLIPILGACGYLATRKSRSDAEE